MKLRNYVMGLAVLLTLQWPVQAQPTVDQAQSTFLKTWSLVESRFYDPGLNGVNVEEIKEHYLPLLQQQPEEAVDLINESLSRLKASHTHLFHNEDPLYFELLDIFSYGSQEKEIRRLFNGELPWYVGVLARTSQGTVQAVVPGGPAERAGLLPGDRIVTADGKPFEPIGSFLGKAGKPVTLQVDREGGVVAVTVTPEKIQPREAFLKSIEDSARVIEVPPYRLGYVRMWSYAGEVYQDKLVSLLKGKLQDTDGLLLDLRGSWGGATPEFASVFVQETEFGLKHRDGKSSVFKSPGYPAPLMLLTDGSVSSGKEILAYNLQKSGRAQITGGPTRAAVVAGGLNLLPNGYALYLAQADVVVDGKRLEARGVFPDYWLSEEYHRLAGDDAVLRNAKTQLLNNLIKRDLTDRFFIDQDARKTAGRLEADLDNQAWLQAIMEHHGWPSRETHGESARTAWLIAQHADNDLELQKRALEMLSAAVEKGKAPASERAYLQDRVLVGQGLPQIYGTQIKRDNGKPVPYEVENPAQLDERRRSVGLPPEAEYLKGFEEKR